MKLNLVMQIYIPNKDELKFSSTTAGRLQKIDNVENQAIFF